MLKLKRQTYLPLIGLAICVILIVGPTAASGGAFKQVTHYTDRADVRAFAEYMEKEHGLARSGILSVLRRARKRQDVLDLISRPAEKVLNWRQYRAIFVQPERWKIGRKWLVRYAEQLARIEQLYHIPPQIVLAIVGVETFYGKYPGKFLVFESLTTLAFEDHPRQKFFRSELEQFFLVMHEHKLNPLDVYGSYAGAMGYGQFIPSSYRAYAVDFDGDMVIDLINNVGDAMASVANYLHRYRWKADQDVAWRVKLARSASAEEKEKWEKASKPKMTLKQWIDRGIVEKKSLPSDLVEREDLRLSMVYLPDWNEGEYWLCTQNFYAITRYNRSNLYAMAVYELAQKVTGN